MIISSLIYNQTVVVSRTNENVSLLKWRLGMQWRKTKEKTLWFQRVCTIVTV